MTENQPSRTNFNLLNPLSVGFELSRWTGGLLYRGAKQGEDRIIGMGRGLMQVFDQKGFVRDRVKNWFDDEKAAAIDEIIKRPNDAQLVELNAHRYVRTAMAHAEEQSEASSDYVDQIERIMRDSGVVPELTIHSTITKLRDKELTPLAHVVTMKGIMEGVDA